MIDVKSTTDVHRSRQRLLKNRDWLDENIEKTQESYGGQWIAVAEEKLVARGSTAEEIRKQVEGKYPEEEIIIISVPRKGEILEPI